MKVLSVADQFEASCDTPLHLKAVVAESWENASRSLLPHKLTECTLAKLLHGFLLTSRYRGQQPGASVVIKSAHGETVVVVELAAEEELCFSFDHLIGFSESVSLRTVLDWSIPSWGMGRFAVNIATGPGQMFFRCAGRPEVCDERNPVSDTRRIQSCRLVLWPVGAEFRTESPESIWDVWFGEMRVYMKCPETTPLLVMDVEQRRVHQNPLWAMISRLYKFW